MNVSCASCAKSYNLPDDRLPQGKMVTFSCPACKAKITLDLRGPEHRTPAGETGQVLTAGEFQDGGVGSCDPKCQDSAGSADPGHAADEIRKKIIQRIDDLPPMPKVLMKARQILSDPNSSFKEIAKVIETDQAIAAKILKVANSAYYGLSGMVTSIHQASVVLGYKTLEELITMASSSTLLGSQLKGYDLNAGELWKHSLAVAIGSRIIAQKRAPSLESDAFSVGLIHDAGKLAMDRYILKRKLQIDDFLANTSSSFLLAERAVLGFDHTEVAHDLCKKWNLPDNHVAAMRYHHSPQETRDNQLAQIVYLANHVSKLAAMGGGVGFDNEPLDPKSMELLRLNEKDMEQIAADVVTAVGEIIISLQN